MNNYDKYDTQRILRDGIVFICMVCVMPLLHGIYVAWKARDNAFGKALMCFILVALGLPVAMLL